MLHTFVCNRSAGEGGQPFCEREAFIPKELEEALFLFDDCFNLF